MSPHCLYAEGATPDLPASGVAGLDHGNTHGAAPGALPATQSEGNEASQEHIGSFINSSLNLAEYCSPVDLRIRLERYD